MTKPDLLPCPFCGHPAEVTSGMFGEIAMCWGNNEECGHRGLMMTVEQWNTRTPSSTRANERGDAVEKGWVIEAALSSPSAPEYWNGGRAGQSWTSDHIRAVRFARKEDADIVADTTFSGQGHRICEHYWIGPRIADNLKHTTQPLEEIEGLEEAITMSASACYMNGVRAYYDTTWIEALVEASRRYLALTAVKPKEIIDGK